MSYTIVGFPSQDQAKAVSESLEKKKKFSKTPDYIVYINQSKPVENLLSKLFTDDIDQEATSVDSLITSV